MSADRARRRVVVATRNEHKLRELREILTGLRLEPLPDDIDLPPEDADTFAANALAKARAARRATGTAAIGDDSGIAAAALGGRPGPRSARYAGLEASDEENLAMLLREVEPHPDRRVAYVCALALVTGGGEEVVVEGRCEGTLAREPRGAGGFGYDPAFVPDETGPSDRRTMAELSAAEKHAISHRGRAARRLAERLAAEQDRPPPVGTAGVIASKSGAAALSVVSNSILIALKIAAGAITGSIAIITEAIHSSIDLLASVVALVSVRKADEPADADHPYGHEKVENLSAAIEGMLILVGAGIIVYEATRRLAVGTELDTVVVAIAVAGFSALANGAVSTFLYRRARAHRSPALEGDAAHLRADALTSLGVVVGLALVELTDDAAFDAIAALVVAVAIVYSGIRILTRSSRVLVDEAPPAGELDRIETAIAAARPPELAGYHKLRARRAGARSHIDLHAQFRSGTSLERAHRLAHELRAAIEREIPNSEVLIHVEPEASLREAPEEEPFRHG